LPTTINFKLPKKYAELFPSITQFHLTYLGGIFFLQK